MYRNQAFSLLLADFLGRRTAWMLGRTPSWVMVTPALFSSSSFLERNLQSMFRSYLRASWRCLGMILVFLLSLAALLASSRVSAARYSMQFSTSGTPRRH